MDRAQIDPLLADLESAITRRGRHKGRRVFYQLLEYDLEPILLAANDPAHVRARVREILVRLGHSPEPPSAPTRLVDGDFGHLCVLRRQKTPEGLGPSRAAGGGVVTPKSHSDHTIKWGRN